MTTLVAQLSRQRLVTIVGPGGIGKTTVALAVAERMIAAYQDGVWLVDLAPLRDPSLVPSAVAGVLGLEIRTENPLPALVAAVKDNRMLLLLDNCEHVIDAAADLAEALLSGTSGVNILATSRERLRVSGEGRVPPETAERSRRSSTRTVVAEAMTFPAVQLFVERVIAVAEDFALTDANVPRVVRNLPAARRPAVGHRIRRACRRTARGRQPRGTPRQHLIAIDRAAPHIKSAPPDHASGSRLELQLIERQDEQQLVRTLGVFSGDFTVEAAAAVSADPREPSRCDTIVSPIWWRNRWSSRMSAAPTAVPAARHDPRLRDREA